MLLLDDRDERGTPKAARAAMEDAVEAANDDCDGAIARE